MKNKLKHPFKEFLFRWGLRKKCPLCGSKLWECGYPSFGWQRMKCSSDKCEFGK
jgi:hypothetical protein